MFFAPRYSRNERTVVGRLRLLGLEGERAVAPDHDFSAGLRDRLVLEAGDRSRLDGRCLAGC